MSLLLRSFSISTLALLCAAPFLSQAFGLESQEFTPVNQEFQCLDYYQYNSVAINIIPSDFDVTGGTTLTFSGTVTNNNEYPIVDGTLFAKIFQREEDSLESVGINPVVDQFVVLADIALAGKGEIPVRHEWQVPINLETGDYYVAYFFTANGGASVSGIHTTDYAPGGMSEFSVTASEAPAASFRYGETTINGVPYDFTAPLVVLDAAPQIVITTELENPNDRTIVVPVQWRQSANDTVHLENERHVDNQLLTLPPNDVVEVSYTVQPQAESVVAVTALVQDFQAKSIMNLRFSQNIGEGMQLFFPAITKFPLVANEPATVFACAHTNNVPVTEEAVTLAVRLLDEAGTELQSYTFSGPLNAALSAVGGEYIPSTTLDFVTVEATLEQAGEVRETRAINYNCETIPAVECQPTVATDTDTASQANSMIIVMQLVAGAVLLLMLIVVFVLFRKKGPRDAETTSTVGNGDTSYNQDPNE